MTWFSPATPAGYLELHARARLARAVTRSDRGASAIEWVIISAILVAISVAIGGILLAKIRTKAEDINLDTP